MKKMNARLVVVGGTHDGMSIRPKLPAILGRGRGSTVKLPYAQISRQHCEIRCENGKLLIRDLGSLNGTVLDSKKVSEAELCAGSQLTIGSLTFRVETLDASEDESREQCSDGGELAAKRSDREPAGKAPQPSRHQRRSRPEMDTGASTDSAGPIDFVAVSPPIPAPAAQAPFASDASVSSDSIVLNPDKYLPPAAPAPPSIPLPFTHVNPVPFSAFGPARHPGPSPNVPAAIPIAMPAGTPIAMPISAPNTGPIAAPGPVTGPVPGAANVGNKANVPVARLASVIAPPDDPVRFVPPVIQVGGSDQPEQQSDDSDDDGGLADFLRSIRK